jgi:outer membrane protein assembly factor BamB
MNIASTPRFFLRLSACRRLALVAFISAALVTTAPLAADEWPQWRGPTRDGVWRETGLVEKFDTDRIADGKLKRLWRAEIDAGYSGPTVADGRVFVTDRQVMPKQIERVHCFAADTGKPLWTFTYDCVYSGVSYVAGPRASVGIVGDRAYALGTMGHLHCLSTNDGTVIWKKDLAAEYKIRMPIWGIAAAPLVEGELVIVHIGGEKACIVAFDRTTGAERWLALDDRASYAAPIVVEQAAKRVVVCWTGDNVVGLNPADGSVYWSHPFKPTRMVIGIATPVVDGSRVFVSSFYDGSLMLDLARDDTKARQVWRRLGPNEQQTDSLHAIISTPYLTGDYVYGVDSYGELRCLDAKTGDRIWEDRTATPRERWSTIHMVQNGGTTWMFNEAGELVIARLSPKGFEAISRAKLLDPTRVQLARREGVCWSHPAFAYKHVFARNDKELVCVSLAADKEAKPAGPK